MTNLACRTLACAAATLCAEPQHSSESELSGFLDQLLEARSREDVLFRDILQHVTGQSILKLDPRQEPDREILEAVADSIRESLEFHNSDESRANEESRINEVSRHFEESLMETLNASPRFQCARPKTLEGSKQTSGYPDLLLTHLASGRRCYLDPKLLHEDSVTNSFRTFYYTPRVETNKVLHQSHHLLIGIQHDGNTGDWFYSGWKLVDLFEFRVRLKAEYQASNRDLYQEFLLLRESP